MASMSFDTNVTIFVDVNVTFDTDDYDEDMTPEQIAETLAGELTEQEYAFGNGVGLKLTSSEGDLSIESAASEASGDVSNLNEEQ